METTSGGLEMADDVLLIRFGFGSSVGEHPDEGLGRFRPGINPFLDRLDSLGRFGETEAELEPVAKFVGGVGVDGDVVKGGGDLVKIDRLTLEEREPFGLWERDETGRVEQGRESDLDVFGEESEGRPSFVGEVRELKWEVESPCRGPG